MEVETEDVANETDTADVEGVEYKVAKLVTNWTLISSDHITGYKRNKELLEKYEVELS